MIPKMQRDYGGWAAIGDGWAVCGRTPEEAREQFKRAELLHREIDARATSPAPSLEKERLASLAVG